MSGAAVQEVRAMKVGAVQQVGPGRRDEGGGSSTGRRDEGGQFNR